VSGARGGLLKVLSALPSDMLIKDRSRTWRVDELVKSLERDGAKPDLHAYVLHRCADGRMAIVPVEASGAISRTASYLEVR
jgi:hypothetical protein